MVLCVNFLHMAKKVCLQFSLVVFAPWVSREVIKIIQNSAQMCGSFLLTLMHLLLFLPAKTGILARHHHNLIHKTYLHQYKRKRSWVNIAPHSMKYAGKVMWIINEDSRQWLPSLTLSWQWTSSAPPETWQGYCAFASGSLPSSIWCNCKWINTYNTMSDIQQ